MLNVMAIMSSVIDKYIKGCKSEMIVRMALL